MEGCWKSPGLGFRVPVLLIYYVGHILGLHRDAGKENGNYHSMFGLHIAMPFVRQCREQSTQSRNFCLEIAKPRIRNANTRDNCHPCLPT